MMLPTTRSLTCLALACAASAACGGSAPKPARAYENAAPAGQAQLVSPLSGEADQAHPDEIVSWVDRQVVTDWPAEVAKRERAIDGYLGDADPGRAAKYGFRSGQHPRLADPLLEHARSVILDLDGHDRSAPH